MRFIDTHCHIHFPDYALPPEDVIKSAGLAGVAPLLCVGCTAEDSRRGTEFAAKHDAVWASIGIHPHEAKEYVGRKDILEVFSALATKPKVVAVGECGLDYFYKHSPKELQIDILKFQIELAIRHNLPMIFHVREAFDDFWPIFESYSGIRGVLHSFTDSMDNLQRALEHGLYIGVNGIATFAKDAAQLTMYQAIPLEKLLLETDAPFLTPTPYRGTINEPKYVRVVAEFLAHLRGEQVEYLAETTTSNAQTLFGLE